MMHPEIFDKFYNAHWFLTGYNCRYFSELLIEGGCTSIAEFIGIMENDVNTVIFDNQQFNQAANYYANKLINNDAWREKVYKKFNRYCELYFKAGERLKKLPLLNMSNKELLQEFEKVTPLQEQVRILGITLNGLVIDGRNHLSTRFREELKKFIKDDKNFDQYWSKLTEVSKLSLRQKKEISIAQLAKLSKKAKAEAVEKELKKIYNNYCWLDYMYYGPPTSLEKFKEELTEAKKENKNLNLVKKLTKVKKEQKLLMKKFNFGQREKFLVNLAQRVLWQKGYRKDVEYHGFYCYEPILKEIAKRWGEADWKNLLYLFPWEFKGLILKNSPSVQEAKARRKFSCLVVTKNKVRMLTGVKAKAFYKKLKVNKDLTHLKETFGQCAFAGKARGKVKIIHVPEDMKKMNQGDIIVSQATSPDLLPAMKKAAAIVTNTGGLICHAAITSRELKISCIVGTGNATLIFKDGDLVEVDAENGVVRKI